MPDRVRRLLRLKPEPAVADADLDADFADPEHETARVVLPLGDAG